MPDERRLAQERDRVAPWKAGFLVVLAIAITAFLSFVAGWLLDAYRGPDGVALPADSAASRRVTPTVADVRMYPLTVKAGSPNRLVPTPDSLAPEKRAYAWADSARGLVRVPIDVAMDVIVAEYAADRAKDTAASPEGGRP